MPEKPGAAPTAESLRSVLRQVIDPEVGLDIVELGLVYDIRVSGNRVEVDFTMTTPSCPMSAMILDDIRDRLGAATPPGTEVVAQLVWEPPWEPAMMGEQARRHFGW